MTPRRTGAGTRLDVVALAGGRPPGVAARAEQARPVGRGRTRRHRDGPPLTWPARPPADRGGWIAAMVVFAVGLVAYTLRGARTRLLE